MTRSTRRCSTGWCGSPASGWPPWWPRRPAAAQAGAARVAVEYRVRPAVLDPEAAMAPGAPLVHGDKTPAAGIADPRRNIAAEVHGGIGDVAAGLADAAAVGAS